MSEDQLKAFLEAIKADSGLQEKLNTAVDADAVVAIARAAGFLISAEDLQRRAQAELSAEELSAEELEGVAGGSNTQGSVVKINTFIVGCQCLPCGAKPATWVIDEPMSAWCG